MAVNVRMQMIALRMIMPDAVSAALIMLVIVPLIVPVMMGVFVRMMSGHLTPHPVRQEC